MTVRDAFSDDVKNVMRSVKALAEAVPDQAPVVVKLVDDERVKPEWRGAELFGFWQGYSPNPKVHAAVRSPVDGSHWIAHVIDVRSDRLLYDLHLNIIESIDIAPNKVQKERER